MASLWTCFNWATSQQKWIDEKWNEPQQVLVRGGFNWATSQQKWIVVNSSRGIIFASPFQLGHFLAEMDSLLLLNGNRLPRPVSIGPLLSRNGQEYWLDKRTLLFRRFNWATSQQKWIGGRTKSLEMIIRGFNWATSQQKWIESTRGVQHYQRNGGFQLGHFLAEMDRHNVLFWIQDQVHCFNWATSQQKWIDDSATKDGNIITCFNWATSQQKWIGKEVRK